MTYPKREIAWDFFLLAVRLWLGRSMIRGGQSILRFFSDKELRDFFENWFGNEMGFPAPLVMAFMAKGTEFFGGILICLGLLTRLSATLTGFVMLIATLAANINYSGKGDSIILTDGLLTISCFLFSILLVFSGGGRLGLDAAFFRTKSKSLY
jgi:uncharacterized membrane protein YphA (DoxX/SURF4 family)